MRPSSRHPRPHGQFQQLHQRRGERSSRQTQALRRRRQCRRHSRELRRLQRCSLVTGRLERRTSESTLAAMWQPVRRSAGVRGRRGVGSAAGAACHRRRGGIRGQRRPWDSAAATGQRKSVTARTTRHSVVAGASTAMTRCLGALTPRGGRKPHRCASRALQLDYIRQACLSPF